MSTIRRPLLGLLASIALALVGLASPIGPAAPQPAYAQISAEFQEALDTYGHWARSERFGEVWVPDQLPPDWRPYQYGHWVYTDEWGWYWISDPEEEDFGWVVYHYGRWARSRALGWFWIPGDEWAPAWVDWRYGGDYVGWAPLPPDDMIDEYDEEPSYWVFVSPRYLGAPRWRNYMVRRERHDQAFRSSHVVNRTLGYGRGRAAINAGISPAFVARASRSAVPTYRVSPRVLAGTQGVAGAVAVSPQQLRAGRPGGTARDHRGRPSGANAVAVQRTTLVQPNAATTAPQPLGKGERGKVGSHPPRAAQGAPPPQPLQQQQKPVTPPPQPPAQQAPVQPQHTAPVAPPPPPAQQAPPPKVERPLAPQTPPPPQQQQRPREEHREPPPRVEEHRPPPPPPPVVNRPPPPAAPPHPAAPPPPHPQPPAAKPPPPPHPAPPPQAAKPAPPPPKPAAKPAPKPEEKKPETPK